MGRAIYVTDVQSENDDSEAAELRDRMVEAIVSGWDRKLSEGVLAALRTVPRHLFTPGASLEEAYTNDSFATKRDAQGVALSTVSAPWVQARMLELAALRPGMRALEIGSGGYNAALMAEVVGPEGEVVSLDIDPEVTERAERLLSEAGYNRVKVLTGDGTYGAAELAGEGGFDAIIVTVQAPDIPAAWRDQLAQNGRLVVPLTFRGTHRVLAFEHEDGHLVSRDSTRCGFVGMQGDNTHSVQSIELAGRDLRLVISRDQAADAETLRAAVASGEESTEWTGVVLRGNEGVLPSLELWLTSTLDPSGTVYASSQAVEKGLSGWTIAATATWTSDTVAYLTMRPDSSGGFELGVRAYGAGHAAQAHAMAESIRTWDSLGRGATPEPIIRVFSRDAAEDQLDGIVVSNRHSRLAISRA